MNMTLAELDKLIKSAKKLYNFSDNATIEAWTKNEVSFRVEEGIRISEVIDDAYVSVKVPKN
ncbi:MAG: hypothetical protein RR338_01030 [Clostridia bacterium]